MREEDRIQRYASGYQSDYGFESAMVDARQRVVLETLLAQLPRKVLEVGCGDRMIHRAALEAGLTFERWVVVEPSKAFGEAASTHARENADFRLVRGFFERSVEEARAALGGAPDLLLLAGLLHEVPDPAALLGAARALLASHGHLHVNVPNAGSFHRRLAMAMGLISSLTEASERQKALMQPTVFDLAGLSQLLVDSGFRVERTGGYLIKPFTHRQMEEIKSVLTPQILNGLWQLGREYPDLASEIFIEARPEARGAISQA